MSDKLKLTPAQESAAHGRIRDNLALRSGAGCGKTLVLARRFTELLLASGGQDNPLSRFAALTFTDKAALEMLQRTRRFLAETAAASKRGSDSRQRLLGWLEELPAARISTIHSFCAGVLRAHAVEAGIDPSFAVCADEIVIRGLVDEAADEALLKAVEDQQADALKLLSRMSYDELLSLVRQLVDRRTEWKAEDYADPAAILDRWQRCIEEQSRLARERMLADKELACGVAEVKARPCADPNDKLLPKRDEFVAAATRLLDDKDAFSGESFAAIADVKLGNFGSDKAWGGGKGAAKQLRDQIRQLASAFEDYAAFAVSPGEADLAAAEALATIAHLAGTANSIYASAKRARGILDFNDLLELTHRLLRDSPDVRVALAAQIDQLLIDECQDTNAFQVELLSMLTLGEAAAVKPPAGRLFIVGDKKQSIYRFRGAQVEVFDDLCRRLGPRNQESLDVSFRTHPAGVAFVNELFAPLMGDDYEPIRASRKESPPHPSVEIILAQPADDRQIAGADDAGDLQAAATAQRIKEMIEGDERLVWDKEAGNWRAVRPGDMAILFARMTNSLAYERQLAARSLPYYVIGGTGFFRRQEVLDVLNALRAIDNPFDDVAFFGVLRSGMFGLDDEALMHVAQAASPPYLAGLTADDLPAAGGLSPQQGRILTFAVGLLGELHRRKDALAIDAIIERLLDETGYAAALLVQFNGRQMLGNVRRLTELARAASADGAALGEFLVQMNRQVLDESRFEQAPVTGEAEDVVRLMTIHKAKGLEFSVVFVPDLNFPRRGVRDKLLNRLDFGLTIDLAGDEGPQADEEESKGPQAQPASFGVAKALEEQDQWREDIRKLYVAATRHKDHLVFVAADWRADGGALRNSGSYIDMMDAQLGIGAAADEGAEIRYADGRYAAAVKTVSAAPLATGPRRRSLGRRMIQQAASAEQLASAISREADRAPAAGLGPIPDDVGKAELAVTALADFEYCPMLYRWRHELRVPAVGADRHARSEAGLDAATAGTLFHRCMELLDFRSPQEAASLVRQAAAEIAIDAGTGLDGIAGELETMLAAFSKHPLSGRVAAARQTFRELYFTLEARPAVLTGQIDMLLEDSSGRWCVIDYKSDRVRKEDADSHAARYELQLLTYAAAAARHLSRPPDEAVVYFLRPAAEHRFELSGEAISAAESRIAKAAAELISARRRRQFHRRAADACRFCPYGPLCRRQP